MKEGYGVDDGAALHFVGNKLAKLVTSSKNAKAVKVSLEDHKVVEQELETVYLGKEK